MPDQHIIAVPAIHGEVRRLERLIDLAHQHWPSVKLVFLGNYLNHGPDSAAVLRAVKHHVSQGHIALRGHAEMQLLQYLDRADDAPDSWNRYHYWGGCQTMRSFEREAGQWFDTRQSMEVYLDGNGTLKWLQSLPVFHRLGNLVFTSSAVARNHWNQRDRPDEAEAVAECVPGGDEDDYAARIGAPPGCFAVCGHGLVVPRRYREGISSPIPDTKSPVDAFVCDDGTILKAGDATHWPKELGRFGPMLFPHGLYLDCGCGSRDDGPLVAAVLRSRAASA